MKTYFAVVLLLLAAPLSARTQQLTAPLGKAAPQANFKGSLWQGEGSTRQNTPAQQPTPVQEEVYAEPTKEEDTEEGCEVWCFELTYGVEFSDRPRNEPGGAREMVGPLSLVLVPHPRLEVEVGFDTFLSMKEPGTRRVTGAGDMSLTAVIVAVEQKGRRPELSFGYTATIPTASVAKGLGSGRVDHLVLAAISKNLCQGGENCNFEVSFGPNFVGRQGESGFVTTGQLNLAYAYEPKKRFGYKGEVAGETRAQDEASVAATTHSLIYKFNDRYKVEAGVFVGLTSNEPRIGFLTSFTVSGDLRKLF